MTLVIEKGRHDEDNDSVIKSYRSQFAEIIKKGTIADLLKQLEKPEEKSK